MKTRRNQRGEIAAPILLIGIGIVIVGIIAGGRLVELGGRLFPRATDSLPSVDIKINGQDGDGPHRIVQLDSPANYTVTWTSSNAVTVCQGTGFFQGTQSNTSPIDLPLVGSQVFSNQQGGVYSYAITCATPSGTAIDFVVAGVDPVPTPTPTPTPIPSPTPTPDPTKTTVPVQVNFSNVVTAYQLLVSWNEASLSGTPVPSGFTYVPGLHECFRTNIQASAMIGSCQNLTRGQSYTITATILQPTGVSVPLTGVVSKTITVPLSGSAIAVVLDLLLPLYPSVDIKVNGQDGVWAFPNPRTVTLFAPATFTVSWTSKDALSCVAREDWEGSKQLSGSQTFVNLASGIYVFTLDCSKESIVATDSILVKVEDVTIPTRTPTPTRAPTVTPTPSPTIALSCGCTGSTNSCGTSCVFDKMSNITYANPILCTPSFRSDASLQMKNVWCIRALRTRGDADGKSGVNLADYDYYRRSVLLDKGIPDDVNTDFNGDGEVGTIDAQIVLKTLKILP